MLAQIQQFWANLSPMAKGLYAGAVALMLAVVGSVGYWSAQPSYAVLFSKLDTESAAAMVQKLDADRVSYKLAGDGTTILVPTSKVHATRMNLFSAGLPQGAGKGYELFDTMSLGSTPFQQQINYVRAIQGELARTIMTLDPVEHARVHIVQPDPTPFAREEKPVTASIMIKTKPGMVMSRAMAHTVVMMSAGSVKGLTPDNVTVSDTEGRMLSEKKDPRGGMVSNDQLAYQREVEAHLADNAHEILARLLGPGRATVRVTAEMSFRLLKETSEKFDPEGSAVLREAVTKSKVTAGNGAKGPVGAVSNIPPAPGNGPDNGAANKNDETVESEFAVSRVNRSQEEQQGLIDRLTVAVMLIPPKAPAEDEDIEDVIGITPAEAQELVKNAVGFKEDRDRIQVSIGKPPAGTAVEAMARGDDQNIAMLPFGRDFASLVQGSSLGIAGVVVLAIGVHMMRRRKSKASAGSVSPAFATANGAGADTDDLADLHAVAATIKAWLEEPAVIRFDQSANNNIPQAKPA
ncbi:flagellar basal-body MS-ring/collar protein FliF [Schlesneria paludicola]|uniref:flagellar basal-body MS-ring/collar protein FliF n=1 Tax=Schlesneria paludicola TaxID=360056 RepID=UPI00029AE446|nr:flagellar basal-body MS-ring/collar protein FliF [Schlesneria paludicola]